MANPKTKVMTIRVPEDQADELDLITRVDGVPMSEGIREAIAAHIATRRADPAFQQLLRERMDADWRIVQRLAGKTETPLTRRAGFSGTVTDG